MRRLSLVPLVLAAALALPSCTTLQEIAALRNVDFDFERVDDTYLAGVDMTRVRSYSDLRATDIARLGSAAARRELPLQFTAVIEADNPESNPTARLVEFDWTLLLDGTETISGVFNDPTVIQSGFSADIPLTVELDLVRFFGDNLRDLVNVALAVSGQSSAATEVAFRIQPTIQTALGPIRYPSPITIVRADVGGR